jgi:hypothetical protein
MTVTVSPSGRLVASSETIEALKRLCAEDAKALDDDRPAPGRPAPNPQGSQTSLRASDDDIEACLAGLMTEAYREARRSFRLARAHTQPGERVEMRDVHVHQATRLTRAFADLVEALARHRAKGCAQRIVVEHVTVHGQAIVGAVNR